MVFAAGLLCTAAVHAQEAGFGRLFYTPEQRAQLEQARRRNISAEDQAAEVASKPKTPRARNVVINGVITRSDGETVVWVNGKPVERETQDGMRVFPSTAEGAVVVREPERGRAVRLKVGQRADLLSGKIEEGYESRRRQLAVEAATQANEETEADSEALEPPRPIRRRVREPELDSIEPSTAPAAPSEAIPTEVAQ
jgi:hypothetical protein